VGSLLVRNIDERIVQALKARAGQHGISAEAEHRRILEMVLSHPARKSFAEIVQSMPDVGKDSDFERRDEQSADNVFD